MNKKNIATIVLASSSTYRKELLSRICKDFEVVAPEIDESRADHESAASCAERLSVLKAKAGKRLCRGDLIIGSDQVAECDGQVLPKPGSAERAFEQLRQASGKIALFHTGLCLLDARNGEKQSKVIVTEVKFRALTDKEIQAYIAVEDVLGCAGSAKSEGLGISLLESINGPDPTALVGLPLISLSAMLRRTGLSLP